jgi:hypothetical protein
MIELILNILVIILFLAVVWFFIFLTVGTDISGTSNGVGTTTMIFILLLMLIGGIAGLIMVLQEIFFL